MREWAAGSWKKELAAGGAEDVLFVHTPFCGTCKAARRMLDVALAMRPELAAASVNLNLMTGFAEAFRIESVPCLLVRGTDGTWSKSYRFGSVVELLERMPASSNSSNGGPNPGEEPES